MASRKTAVEFDEIGYWSEIKLDIVRKYALAYSKILSTRTSPSFYHVYIDGFAGAGVHFSREKQTHVPGSPINALEVKPPFREYHLIDSDPGKVMALRQMIGDRPDVQIYEGDCNSILLHQVFPRVRYDDFRRGLCFLDPYGLQLNWEVIEAAGKMKSIDLILNFPVEDMNRTALWRNPEKIPPQFIKRMTAFWGDESWRNAGYRKGQDLLGEIMEKEPNAAVVEAFRTRLSKKGEFKCVPEPIAMRNSKKVVIYYLFFASQHEVAERIARDIFNKYAGTGGG